MCPLVEFFSCRHDELSQILVNKGKARESFSKSILLSTLKQGSVIV